MTPQELKNSILQQAIQGKLVEQRPEEGTAEELFQLIQKEKQRLIADGKIKKEKPLPEITEDEKPFDIPENWKWVRLGEICQLLDSEIIHDKKFPYLEAKYLRGKAEARILETGKFIKAGTKVILVDGENSGEVFDIPEDGYMGSTFKILFMPSSIFTDYVLRFLELHKNTLKNNKKGAAIPHLNKDIFFNLNFPLPPFAEQKRIVAKIEELLPYIHRYEESWLKLEAFNSRFPDDMKKSLLQYAIQGKLVEQRPEEGTAEELFERIQKEKQRLIAEGKIKKEKPLPEITEEEKPFDIPESWKWVRIGDVCINIQYGSSQKSSQTGKIAVLRMGNLQDGKIILDKLVYTSDEEEIKKYPLQYGDLLFNRTNSKELVGKTAIYRGEIPAIYAGYLVRLTPLLAESDYINYVMQSTFYWNYCQSVRSDAIGQSNINAEKLKRFEFPLPPLPEQKRIVAKLEELLPLCERLK